MLFSLNRFMKLCLLRKTGVGAPLSKKLFVASVIFACVINIPCGWIFGKTNVNFNKYEVNISYCFIKSDDKEETVFKVYFTLLSAIFIAVCTTLVVLYYKIVRTLQDLSAKHEELKRRPSLAAGVEVIKKQKQSEVMKHSAIVFITVTVVFFASYTPYFITLVLSMADPSLEGSMTPALKALYDLAKLCPLINNMANPFIYSFTSDHFRDEVKKMLTFKSCEKGFFRRRAMSLSGRSQELSQISDSRED